MEVQGSTMEVQGSTMEVQGSTMEVQGSTMEVQWKYEEVQWKYKEVQVKYDGIMDNNEIEQLITLTGERFYELIEEQYGKSVGKILRYHDIDCYSILSQIDKHALIDLFEKPNDEHSTSELIDLKKEICNISHESISLKIGTKNKIILLLKSSQEIVKKRRLQLVYEARLNRLDKRRSTSSSSTNNSASDSENNLGKYHALLEESIIQLLRQLKNNIHGTTYTNVSANDFKVIIGNTSDCITPVCSVQCICGDRI
ncbi:unnamed protein product, partial [Rotaria socialis]